MKKETKRQINQALTMFKLVLMSNGCGLATDNNGHLFIFNNKELKEKGNRLENCDGIVVNLKDLVG